ncbi:MAG: hypothetical protein AAF221_07870 [Pseudomonadota bacterium]
MNTRKGHVFGMLGAGFHVLGHIIAQWKLIVIVAFFVSPVGPHLRWEYEYRAGYNGYRAHVGCTYLGSRGFVSFASASQCPVLVWMDSRKWRIE